MGASPASTSRTNAASRKAARSHAAAVGDEWPANLPRVSAAQRARAAKLLAALEQAYPDAHCELVYTSPHELLVATILSAQCTDAAVNKATPALFARFPSSAAFAASRPAEIEPFIRSLGFFRAKARSVHESMRAIVERFGGEVPRTMAELLTLRGVARKTANVVLGNVFGINVGIPVDTHIERLSVRLGLAPRGASVAAIEKRLMALFPRDRLCDLSHMIIWHGRRACKARPPGGECADHPICRAFGRNCECRVQPRSAKPASAPRPRSKASPRAPSA